MLSQRCQIPDHPLLPPLPHPAPPQHVEGEVDREFQPGGQRHDGGGEQVESVVAGQQAEVRSLQAGPGRGQAQEGHQPQQALPGITGHSGHVAGTD